MQYKKLLDSLNLTAREAQEETLNALDKSLSTRKKVNLFQVDTGVGKTLAIGCAAVEHAKSDHKQIVIATKTLTLVKDMYKCIESIINNTHFGEYKPTLSCFVGKSHYVCKERVERFKEKLDNLSSTEENALNLLSSWDETIDEFIEEFGELPFELKAKDICLNVDSTTSQWEELKYFNTQSDIVITTHKMITIDMKKSQSMFDTESQCHLIIDEADQFVDLLISDVESRLNIKRLLSRYKDEISKPTAKVLKDLNKITTQKAGDKSYNSSEGFRSEILKSVNKLIKQCEKSESDKYLCEEMKLWMFSNLSIKNIGYGISPKNKEPALISLDPYKSRLFGAYIKKKFENASLLSGTLSTNFELDKGLVWVNKYLGIKDDMKGGNYEFSPHDFGKLSLTLLREKKNNLYINRSKGSDNANIRLNPLWVEEMCENILSAAKGKAIILTTSHEESMLFSKHLDCVLHEKNSKLSDVIAEFIDSKKQFIITASGHTGVNISKNGRSILDDVFITRLGFKPPSNFTQEMIELLGKEHCNRLKAMEHFSSINLVARRIKQAIGRGIRSEKDEIHVCILDDRFPDFDEVNAMKVILKSAIPKRFIPQYHKATKLTLQEEKEFFV
jgi:ATP-dependent DNA helicase DinG